MGAAGLIVASCNGVCAVRAKVKEQMELDAAEEEDSVSIATECLAEFVSEQDFVLLEVCDAVSDTSSDANETSASWSEAAPSEHDFVAAPSEASWSDCEHVDVLESDPDQFDLCDELEDVDVLAAGGNDW